MGEMREETVRRIWKQYEADMEFKSRIRLFDTVQNNENFFVGKQWEGVKSNGLPTPVFNYIKRIVLYLVASTATDNLKLNATPLGVVPHTGMDRVCRVVNEQFEALFEQNKLTQKVRGFVRSAAVDGDACLYTWFDPEAETGQTARGAIRTELVENTRVCFGNPNSREVQTQPWIILARREIAEQTARRAERFGGESGAVRPDSEEENSRMGILTDDKCTVLLRLHRDPESGHILASETTRGAVVRPEWDTGLKYYPVVWMCWDEVPDCCHGQAAVTGLIPNQIFVNKMFAMTMISLMTTAYPKVVYDRTRVAKWDSRVGAAIPVNGGDMNTVARTVDPAVISPQVSQFIQLAISMTKEFMGATDAALGEAPPNNTSAILALQKASAVPLELVRLNLHQCLEDLGVIWLDLMRVYYGVRYVAAAPAADGEPPEAPETFDFALLREMPMQLKLDVGGSSYWSEISQISTLDNLLARGQIDVIDYLERIPKGYIKDQQQLIDTLKERRAALRGE